ncbi:MAG: hypothetical protein IKL41_06420 [Clostridia bacterium]|nr:hypothetical protein [Clostridia bacterium]
MRDCLIHINNDNTVDVSSVSQYIGEHAATQLIIALNDELNTKDIHYYTLSFGMCTDFPNPYLIKFSSDAITDKSAYGYADEGKIYFVLPKALTLFSTLQIQVEAHSTDIFDNIIRTVKSPVFEVAFNKSVDGEETIIPENSFAIIEEMRKALAEINAVSGEIAEIRSEIESINGSVDEIEALIDESGVLE